MMNPIADDIFYVLYSSYCLTSSLFGINFTMVSTPCDASACFKPEHMLAVVEKYRYSSKCLEIPGLVLGLSLNLLRKV